jgi:thioredoxin 1
MPPLKFAMYQTHGPTREEVDATQAPTVLQFGSDWCGFCQAAAPAIATALEEFPAVQHIQVEDGPGQPLGRSFRVKLWPTLVFWKDGVEVARVVRPQNVEEIREALRQIA